MKKYSALPAVVFAVLFVFASCAKGTQTQTTQTQATTKVQLTAVTNATGEGYYPVTDENGNAVRDGESIAVYVTDANGNPIENQTEMQTFEYALEVGNRIEMPGFRITVPEGWVNFRSFTEISIGNTETLDIISVSAMKDITAEEKQSEIDNILATIKKNNEDAVVSSEEITVGGETAVYKSAVIDNENGEIYLGYAVFSHGGYVYDCRLSADRRVSEEEITGMVDILKSIEFVR